MENPDPIPDSLADTPEGEYVRGMNRRHWLKLGGAGALAATGGGGYYWYNQVPLLHFDGHYAHASTSHPPVIHYIVAYANELVDKPYRLGGGHKALFDDAFDCSGSVSHILNRAGLLVGPLNSTSFVNYGLAGPGAYVTLFVKPRQHVFMSVCGLRFDTTGGKAGEGPRWRAYARNAAGFLNRHPPGL
jgi:hypothetical protein